MHSVLNRTVCVGLTKLQLCLVNSVRFLTTFESARTRSGKWSCISVAKKAILKQGLYSPFITLKKLFGILQNERLYFKKHCSEFRWWKCESFIIATTKNPTGTTPVRALSLLTKCKLVHHSLAWLLHLTWILQAAWAYRLHRIRVIPGKIRPTVF